MLSACIISQDSKSGNRRAHRFLYSEPKQCILSNYQFVDALWLHINMWHECDSEHIQWNLSWETTAMTDHLSWKTTQFWQKDFQYNWTCYQKPPVLRDHIFVANGVVFQRRSE